MTARDRILKHLQSGKTLTTLQAWRLYGTTAMSQHASALRRRGYKIGSYIPQGVRYAKYFLTY